MKLSKLRELVREVLQEYELEEGPDHKRKRRAAQAAPRRVPGPSIRALD